VPHTCNYFCQEPVHAVHILVELRSPYECLSHDLQRNLREQILLDIRTIETSSVAVVVEQLLPVRDCSTIDFYQCHAQWSIPNLTAGEGVRFGIVKILPR